MTGPQGKFVWYELMTTDTDAARQFYGDLVCWKARNAGVAGMDYTLLSADGVDVGGLMEMPERVRAGGAAPFWIGYIWADDVDAMAEKAITAGGSVHRPPADISGVGRFAVVADPDGATFCLFRGLQTNAGGSLSAARLMTPGHTGWHELTTGDPDGAFAFYSGLFGWEKGEAIDMGPMGVYQVFGRGGVMMGGMMQPTAERPAGWRYYFTVPQIRAAAERVKTAGGSVIAEPMEVPGGAWVLHATDPQGACFALVAPPA